MLLVIHTVERFIFEEACKLGSAGVLNESADDSSLCVMEGVVDTYRLAVSAMRQSPSAKALLSVEMRSRETLAVWAAFCFAHHFTKRAEPLLKDYSVAPRWSDLRHLVVSEKLAVDAARHVAAYLRANDNHKPSVFSLRSNDATMDLARRHALDAPITQQVWREEQAAATQRSENHRQEVLAKQATLHGLDAELLDLESSLTDERSKFVRLVYPSYEYRETERKISDLDSEAKATRSQIKREEQPPSPILQPLPQSKLNAMPILFFLKMPPTFQVLSRLSFTAQQMLLPPTRPPQSAPVQKKRRRSTLESW
jgi:hypothetical protein